VFSEGEPKEKKRSRISASAHLLKVLAGKHALLPFELFQTLQRTYSWMKYYNSKLESSNRTLDEKVVKELLEDARKSIDNSLRKLRETDDQKMNGEWL
jgi:hypothetical protein